MADPDLPFVKGRQFGAGAEAVDRVHQIEHRVAQNAGVIAYRYQAGMWHIGVCQSGQYPRLTQDHLVADWPEVTRASTEHVGSSGPVEPQQNVLRAAADLGDVVQWTL